MRKIILSFVCLLLVSVYAYADQTLNGRQTREWDVSTNSKPLEGKDYTGDTTAYTNLVVTGHQATGNAGYIALMAADQGGNLHTYYLWVDGSVTPGKLMMASFPALTASTNKTSFPYGDWRSTTGFTSGVKVSSQ